MEKKRKLTLEEALEVALSKKSEMARILSVIDCIRGYKNCYEENEHPQEREGFSEAMKGLKLQRNKVKKIIKKHLKRSY